MISLMLSMLILTSLITTPIVKQKAKRNSKDSRCEVTVKVRVLSLQNCCSDRHPSIFANFSTQTLSYLAPGVDIFQQKIQDPGHDYSADTYVLDDFEDLEEFEDNLLYIKPISTSEVACSSNSAPTNAIERCSCLSFAAEL